jgi:hypothetical protein
MSTIARNRIVAIAVGLYRQPAPFSIPADGSSPDRGESYDYYMDGKGFAAEIDR